AQSQRRARAHAALKGALNHCPYRCVLRVNREAKRNYGRNKALLGVLRLDHRIPVWYNLTILL
ncbi:MAG: hypothetical protein RR739_04490, partial [Clostridia bacterium]